MNFSEIAQQRFSQQGLTAPWHTTPAEVVAWNGALQAQDYAGAKWAVAQRLSTFASDATLEAAFDAGDILRTHVMRPTWHFVAPADIRWLLRLTAPRVHKINAYYYRSQGLDAALLRRSTEIIARALEGNQYHTRTELGDLLQREGIATDTLRLGSILMYAELEEVICSGPRHGKQFTYALLEERVPPAPLLDHDAACAELAKRYFTSHGPALIKDFVWWSGLTVAQAKLGIDLAGAALCHMDFEGQRYWLASATEAQKTGASQGYLLPNYDEALASFKDYRASVLPQYQNMWADGNRSFPHYLVIDGIIVGTWRRTLRTHEVLIEYKPFAPLDDAQRALLAQAAESYGQFLGLEVIIEIAPAPVVG